MGQNTSALERFKSEVVLAVQDNNARRLYHLFILATRHQLGELTVVPPSSSSSSSGNVLVQLVRQGGQAATGAAVSVEEYMRSVMASTARPQQHVPRLPRRPQQTSQQQQQQQQLTAITTASITTPPSPPLPRTSSRPAARGALSRRGSVRASTPPASSAASSAGGGYVNFSGLRSVDAAHQSAAAVHLVLLVLHQHAALTATAVCTEAWQLCTAIHDGRDSRAGREDCAGGIGADGQPYVHHRLATLDVAALALTVPPVVAYAISTLGSPTHSSSSATSYTYSSVGPVSISAPPPPPPTTQTNPFASSSSTAEFSRSTIPVNINTLYVGSEPLLHYAAKQDQTSIIHLLYQAGADVELADMNGWSALIHAAAAGSVRAVRALLDIGADALAKTKTGLTPSQCTTSGEIRKELEIEEDERRQQHREPSAGDDRHTLYPAAVVVGHDGAAIRIVRLGVGQCSRLPRGAVRDTRAHRDTQWQSLRGAVPLPAHPLRAGLSCACTRWTVTRCRGRCGRGWAPASPYRRRSVARSIRRMALVAESQGAATRLVSTGVL